jgi:hypothetical protein
MSDQKPVPSQLLPDKSAARRESRDPVSLIRQLWLTSPPLTLLGVIMGFLTVFFVLGIWTDSRVILGQPAWLKPAKFGVSITLYALTLTWLLGFVRTSRPWQQKAVRALGWIMALVFSLEMLLITIQAARGTASHFNFAATFDQALYGLMGISIMVFWIANVLLAAALAFMRFESRAFGWSVRLGLIIALIGMAEAFLMTTPTAAQLASWHAGAPVTVIGGHAVGAPDAGPGLPLTGWSAAGGDLRVAHFFGMHALQALPFFGWFISRRRFTEKRQLALVSTSAAGYLGLTLLLTWQALRGQPLTAPDSLTTGAFLGLITALGAAALLLLRPERRTATAVVKAEQAG